MNVATLHSMPSRLTQAVESPTTATTTYAYDDANRLTSEDGTGSNPYLSDYTYNNRGLRATAFRSEGGVTSHDGTYSYDAASRLTQVVEQTDSPSTTEYYTWNDDSTLATYPGPGYTRVLDYDEEGRVTKISRLSGGVTTPKFEYAYGFDGGRRWRKDLDGDVWNWYPCGVACCAGELVALEATISGSQTWTATSTSLPTMSGSSHDGSAFVPSATSFLAREVVGGPTQGSVTADQFGVLRATTGSGAAYYGGWHPAIVDDEQSMSLLIGHAIREQQGPNDKFTNKICMNACASLFPDNKKFRGICEWVCKTLKGKTCNQLFSYCMHLGRGGLPGKRQAEVCMSLYDALCAGATCANALDCIP